VRSSCVLNQNQGPEAISLISIAVDFGVAQVVDGNWGMHAIIKKSPFAEVSV
jgi:acetamidase/formamidase